MNNQEALNFIASIFGDQSPALTTVNQTITEPTLFGQVPNEFYLIKLTGAGVEQGSLSAALQEVNGSPTHPIFQVMETESTFDTGGIYLFCTEVDVWLSAGSVKIEGWRYIKN